MVIDDDDDDEGEEGLSSLSRDEHARLYQEAEEKLRRSVLGEPGESPGDSRTERIPLGLIDPNPQNPRKTFHRIQDLAATIEGLGLLQNLVVVRKGERYELRAGERRLRAMNFLVEKKSPGWSHEKKISCLVLGRESVGELEAIVENGQRQDLPPWEEGARFARIVEGCGLTAQEIGKQIGKSRSYVNLLIRISRGLSPKIVPILARIGSAGPNLTELDELAGISDKDTLGPDHEKQKKWLEKFLNVETTKRRRRKSRSDIAGRVRMLEDMDMPETVRHIVDAVVHYLQGGPFVLPEFVKRGGVFAEKSASREDPQ
jgi:ParB family chromosome partitioning protein